VVTHRNEKNSFGTEEIDVALYNDDDRGAFRSLPNIILIECKNWSHRVGSSEVAWFITKLRSRGLDFGILISTLGITGDTQDLTAAHHLVAMELADKRKLIVLTTHELESLVDTDQLALLIKTKLCELAVKGSIV
jgi:predicted helicase